jgi:aldehyde dehydrogenase (NAD+)
MNRADSPANLLHAQLRDVFERQAGTALRLRQSTWQERVAKIRRLRDAVTARTDAWYQAAQADFQKPPGEVDLAEILPVCQEANAAMAHLRQWMKPQRVWPTLLTLGTRSEVQFVPRGRCLILGPFNYPVNLTLGPLISAVAAGNTAIVKPSELTPHLSRLIAEVVGEVFSEDEVAVFEGDAQLAQSLQALAFDHIFFTGSPAVGKQVMAAAAQHLASVTLELGGKSPVIVDASADLQLAARNILWAKLANAGQTCIAPDHVYVHDSVKDRWVQHCREELERAYGSSLAQHQSSPHLARIVNTRHAMRLLDLLMDAQTRGARVLAGGAVFPDDRFVQPTLLDHVPPEARISHEEIFGPLLPVIGFHSLSEVIATIQAAPKPLALYLYSRDSHNIDQVIRQTVSGGVCINHALIQFLHSRLPFGGINHSGIGSAHGHYGFKAFSHERAVVRSQLPWLVKWWSAGEVPALVRRALVWARGFVR